jgi:hypothetical protein
MPEARIIDDPVWAWISLGAGLLSATMIGAHILAGNRQHMAVMNMVWPITGLYMGPFGLWAYWYMARRSGHDHEQQKPFWQRVFVSATHCGAGCTFGDVVSEGLLFYTTFVLFGSALYTAFAVDFAFAYLFGILFQYAAIVPMKKLSPWRGLLEAVKADTLSLVAFQVGMYFWMALTQTVLFQPRLQANDPRFWFMMQIAMMIGFATTYPMNAWLVRRGIKHGM